jgi:hypothetical protein
MYIPYIYIHLKSLHNTKYITKVTVFKIFVSPRLSQCQNLYTYYIIIYLLEGVNFNNLLQKKKTIYFKGKKTQNLHI